MKILQVGEVVGEYKVIGIAGSGGMGTVYKIEHLITRRVEAMKIRDLEVCPHVGVLAGALHLEIEGARFFGTDIGSPGATRRGLRVNEECRCI